VQGEDEHAGGAHRDWDPDSLHDGLHRQTLLDRDNLISGVDRRARGAVGRRDVGDAKQASQHEQSERRGARTGRDEGHDREHSDHDCRVQDQPEPQAETAHQRAG